MPTHNRPPSTTETEIKLALPVADPAAWADLIARTPVLARRQAVRQQIYSIYYDTPTQTLRQQRSALRLRRVGTPEQPHWLQTFKTAGHSDSALSQRGEWEMPVAGPALELGLLHASPWPQLDPDTAVAATLQPCFVTDFERTRWTVRLPGGAVVEVALDIGHIAAGARQERICELELELLSGTPEALFTLARRIARSVPVLPLAASKAERGYALLQAQPAAAAPARAPLLSRDMPLTAIARRTLGEALRQFTAQLHALQTTDDPEPVHQARVGWRRFRSLWRLLRPALPGHPLPDCQALQPLLERLGALRDLDVARTQTLPALAELDGSGEATRALAWQALQQALAQAAERERAAVRQALAQPAVGGVLLALAHWLETLDGPLAVVAEAPAPKPSTVRWLRKRMARLAQKLQAALHDSASASGNADLQHRARLLAKRLRYGTEALAPLLPRHLQHEHEHGMAGHWQRHLGTLRDVARAATLARQLGAAPELVAFLHGFAAGLAQAEAPQNTH